MAQRDRPGNDGGDASIGGTQAIVGVLEVAVEGLVESTDAIDAVAAHVGQRECDALHASRRGVLADVAFRQPGFGLLAPQFVGLDETAGVIEPAFGLRTEQAGADDAVLRRSVGGVAEAFKPVGLGEQEVVVEQDHVGIGVRGGDARVHAAHETEVLGQRNDVHAVTIRRQRGWRLVAAAVVDDDHLGRVRRRGEQGVEAASRGGPLVPRQHDQRGSAHLTAPAATRPPLPARGRGPGRRSHTRRKEA